MKVLQVHNYYREVGGERNVINKEKALLESKGHEVYRFTKKSSSIDSFFKKVKLLKNLTFSNEIYDEFLDYCSSLKPKIIHVHNTYPIITPSVFYAAKKVGIPVVYTLHNYRLLYPNGLMLNDGSIDERTLKGSAYQTVKDRVYKDSFFYTFALAHLIEHHREKKTWETKVDQFIALTNFAKCKFIKGGLLAEKISIKPNFVEDPFRGSQQLYKSNQKKEGYFFVGRISKEKGIEDLVSAWLRDKTLPSLNIAGDGPLKNDLKFKTNDRSNINWLGNISNKEVFHWLNKAKAMIFPSTWYEGFPMTILESLSIGCPVITSNIGSQQSIIEDEVTGLHFKVSDSIDLLDKVERFEQNSGLVRELGANAREKYLQEYTPEKNYEILLKIYEEVCFK